MLRYQSRKAQSTAEYVIVLGLIVAAVMAMQTYVKRGFQGKIKDAVDYTDNGGTSFSFKTGQYEPDYLSSSFNTNRSSSDTEDTVTGGGMNRTTNDESTRTGSQSIGSVSP